jgi:hypothetical protein
MFEKENSMRGELPREKFDHAGHVICQVCGKAFLTISPKHLKRIHNLTYGEYFLRYPEAPKCSDEFGAMVKYRRDRNNAFEAQVHKQKECVEKEDEFGDEVIVCDEVGEPNEELVDPGLEKLIEQAKHTNPLDTEKGKILNILKMYFTNIQKDYLIQIFNIVGRFQFEFISDFSDPVLKINVEFPNTFWHNVGRFEDPLRDIKLEEYGWKVIRVNSRNPSIKDIENSLKNI